MVIFFFFFFFFFINKIQYILKFEHSLFPLQHQQKMTIAAETLNSGNVIGNIQFNYFYVVVGFEILNFLFLQYLYQRQLKCYKGKERPSELKDVITEEEFKKSQEYGYTRLVFKIFTSNLMFYIEMILYYIGFIPYLWDLSGQILGRFGYYNNEYLQSIGLFSISIIISTLQDIPFSLYSTFVIEQKFGFNKMTIGLFIKDKIMSLVLVNVIGSPVIVALLYIMNWAGDLLWFYVWIFLLAFAFLAITLYPTLIQPLFNTYSPVEGELQEAIFDLAKKVQFPATKMFIVNESKRSSHSNAYFYGFFKNKRIVLYDTLVKNFEKEEILAVLAHEMGHYRLNHVLKSFILSQFHILFIFYSFGFFIKNTKMYRDFGFSSQPIFIGLMLFQGLLKPVDSLVSFLLNCNSRKHEYEADTFAVNFGYDTPDHLIKLYVKDSGSLIVDPLYSAYHNSHPTLLERMANIKKQAAIAKKSKSD